MPSTHSIRYIRREPDFTDMSHQLMQENSQKEHTIYIRSMEIINSERIMENKEETDIMA